MAVTVSNTRLRGRPSRYTTELAGFVLDRMMEGMTVEAICRANPHLPTAATIRGWASDDHRGFSHAYTRARAMQMEALLDQALDIADGRHRDPDTVNTVIAVERDRLAIKARLRLAALVDPSRYAKAGRGG